MHRVGTEQRVLLPDEIRDINNRMIGINPDSLAPKLLRQAVMNQKQKDNITPVLSCPQGMAGVERISGVQSVDLPVEPSTDIKPVRRLPFIEANTKEVCVGHLKNDCIIPVFSKDNEVTISHLRFIETIYDAANEVFRGERVDNPDVRVSHIIKGRIPEAINKPVNQLLESDKTIYYERMMFCIEIPTIHEDIAGNRLNLTIGGVRAYNQENLYSRKTFEKFKLFIGFKNMVCCNLCVSTDGY